MVVDLDDPRALAAVDRSGALGMCDALAEQFRRPVPPEPEGPLSREMASQVLVLGTGGGSAAAARLLRAYAADRCPVPILLHQGYGLPAFARSRTLVIAVSHSGETEEVLDAYREALAAGVPTVAVTSGGTLEALARRRRQPVVPVPGGIMPRMALGYLFSALLGVLERAGLLRVPQDEREGLYEVLAEGPHLFGAGVPTARNPAKQLALRLEGRIPVIYGLHGVTDAAADRWKRQLGENGKVMAFANRLPDAHHDEAVGWGTEPEALRGFHFVLLDDEHADPRLRRRLAATAAVLDGRAGGVTVVAARGRGRLARLFSLVHLGDYVSLYLALRRGIDPTPVPMVDHFKAVLAEG